MYAIYARQSLDKKDSISIEAQIEFCKRECGENEYIVYFDKGFSGSNIDRPQFQKLLFDIKSNKITKIVVYRLDRMSRSILDFSELMQIFDEYKVEFVSCTEKFDTSTPIGRAMLSIVMVFAQLERETIQQRVKDNYYERCKRGAFGGGGAPYGFDFEKKIIDGKKVPVLIKNENKAKIVAKIYDMYANNDMSLMQISKYLNNKHIETENNGKAWTSNVVGRILKNASYVKADENVFHYLEYKGCIMANDINEYKNTSKGIMIFGDDKLNKFKDLTGFYAALGLHNGFIDSNLWIKANQKAYNNKQIANSSNSENTWLSGLTKCGNCGYAITYKKCTKNTLKNGKKEYEYLKCSGTNYDYCNKTKLYKLNDIEQFVYEELFNHLKQNPKKYSVTENENIELNSVKIELLNINKKIEKLIDSMTEAEDITMNYINKAISKLDERKNTLLKELEKHNIKISMNESFDIDAYHKKWSTLDLSAKKKFVRNYINKIIILDNNIDIVYK